MLGHFFPLSLFNKQDSDLIDLWQTWREMENLILENSFGFLETFLRIFGGFFGSLEKLIRCEKIKVLRPLWHPNSHGDQI